ncbi:MAG TPA: crotonase/enoyl-CoA hydratase family protein [Marinospirillum sp.]|uniref:crotonase/enoyl-CoA hydratase family protein n=1 Tax=Marinospirillum sp. TaxID=2183934 RepID=UPI002B49B9F7|nr:crotonase/enoyl-CoA hydratase family protein [Marinospirillum sp.]HKM16013.1 crotonase/enoyl-CoA hydratase family protein [Marinospirillum sp.]
MTTTANQLEEPSVKLSLENGIARVVLNRPAQHNSLNIDLVTGLLDVLSTLNSSRDLRVVILSGSNHNFCSGLDVAGVMTDPKNIQWLLSGCDGYPHNKIQHLALGWRSLHVPVIAAIEGYCFGGGLQMALGADLRIAHPTARLSVMEGRWGIIPDMGISVTARGCVKEDVLMRMTITAEVVDGEAALTAGMVTELADDPLARAESLAAIICNRSPDMVKAAKHLLRDSYTETDEERLALEEKLQRRLLGTANQMEAVMANIQKRDPVFTTD